MKKTENFDSFLKINKLSRREMKHVVAGLLAPEDGGSTCKVACTSCSKNSECCSTVCAGNQPGCGGGNKCLK
jgi:hypothetical protein